MFKQFMSMIRVGNLLNLSTNSESLVTAGDRANRQKNWSLAEKYYSEALEIDPNLSSIWVQLGHARKELGETQSALEAYTHAITLDDTQHDFFLQRGHANKLLGRYSDALTDYKKSLSLHPGDPDVMREVEALNSKHDAPTFEIEQENETGLENDRSSEESDPSRLFDLAKWHTLDPFYPSNEQLEKYIFPMFSPDYYRKLKNASEKLSGLSLWKQYLEYDFVIGLPPGPLFDESYYRQFMGTGAGNSSHEPPLHHWLNYGVRNRISPNPLYSDHDYLMLNADLVSWPDWLFVHFLHHGIIENRHFHPILRLGVSLTSGVVSTRKPPLKERLDRISDKRPISSEFLRMAAFRKSDSLIDTVAAAAAIDPNVGSLELQIFSNIPPLHDSGYADYLSIRELIPQRRYKNVIVVPFCKLGGADFIAGILSANVGSHKETLILRTDDSEWFRPDWFPAEATSVDLSKHFGVLQRDSQIRILYEVIREIKPEGVYNVNSKLAFELFEQFGGRLSLFTHLYAYYFCSDKTLDGHDVGYPVHFFANILPHLRNALVDSAALADTLTKRYDLKGAFRDRVKVVYTPAMVDYSGPPLVDRQIENQDMRRRPILLWGGRFDRQKRFDLVIGIAKAMPEIDFHCWGKAVLDQAPDLTAAPSNMRINPPYASFDELPIRHSDGWLYTSAWDGLPTVLIECAALGIPIVASDVGGVSELITNETGYIVKDIDNVSAYVSAIRALLSDSSERRRRAENLQKIARVRHSKIAYQATLDDIQRAELNG